MPTYDYSCRSCGFTEEVVCRIADRPDSYPCSKCGGEVRQDMSAPLVEADDIVNVPWIREFAHKHGRQQGKRNRFGGPPIQSRTDYKQYLKNHNLRDPHKSTNLTEM